MRGKKTFKGIYLMIAFAIFWVSFSSIIQFHLTQIYGNDLTSSVEFVKTSDSKTLKKDPKLFLKMDQNFDDFTAVNLNYFKVYLSQSKFYISKLYSQSQKVCIDLTLLRGPPTRKFYNSLDHFSPKCFHYLIV
jgi:hypothetical protein